MKIMDPPLEKLTTDFVSGPQATPKTTNSAIIGKYGSANVSDLEWPSKGQDAMSEVRYGHVLT